MIKIIVDSIYERADMSGVECAYLECAGLTRAAILTGYLHQGQHVALIDSVGALWHTGSMLH